MKIFLANSSHILKVVITLCVFSTPNCDANNTSFNLSYYYDDRDFNTLTFFVLNNNLGSGFSFLGFTDFHSNHNDSSNRDDFSRSFTEFRLSNNKLNEWWNTKGLEVELEYNDLTPGNSNNLLRLGITYKQIFANDSWLKYRIFPMDTKHDGQASLVYFVKFTEQFNLSGFADYTFTKDGKGQWVFEPQLNYGLTKQLWLLLEYRHNDFEKDNPALDGNSVALGIRYNF